MSGECSQCGEHAVDCECKIKPEELERVDIAINMINMGLQTLNNLGYILQDDFKFNFKVKK